MADDTRAVSRLPALAQCAEDPVLVELFARMQARGRRVLNIHRVVGHAPKIARAQLAYAAALREDSSLPRDLQELLILRVAQVNGSDYEPSVHRRIAVACGIAPAKIEALASWGDSGLFDSRERTLLRFVDQAAGSGEVDEKVFSDLRENFTPQEIVELAALIGWYVGNSRFARALQVEPESEQT